MYASKCVERVHLEPDTFQTIMDDTDLEDRNDDEFVEAVSYQVSCSESASVEFGS